VQKIYSQIFYNGVEAEHYCTQTE